MMIEVVTMKLKSLAEAELWNEKYLEYSALTVIDACHVTQYPPIMLYFLRDEKMYAHKQAALLADKYIEESREPLR